MTPVKEFVESYLVPLALLAVFVVIYGQFYKRSKIILQKWAGANGFQIIESERGDAIEVRWD